MLLVRHETDRMDADQERELIDRWREGGDRAALDCLIRSHIRGVILIAREYRHRHGNLDDLIQEGMVGLLRAVGRFDADRGTRFFSYAAWWIRASIREFLLRSRRLVRVGRTQAERRIYHRLGRVRQEVDNGYPELSGTEKRRKMAELLEVEPEVLEQTEVRLSGSELVLDSPTVVEGPTRVVETVASEGPGPDELAAHRERDQACRDVLEDALEQLSERERTIIAERFLGPERRTLRSIGEDLGVSRERVRQIQVRGLRKLRQHLREQGDVDELIPVDLASRLGAA